MWQTPRMGSVRFHLHSGQGSSDALGPVVEVQAGQIIGRSAFAALRVDDPRVSEAHALVSLREGRLRLLSLRRRFLVEGRTVEDAVLTEGLEIELASGVLLEVVSVDYDDCLLSIRGPGMGAQVIPDVASLVPSAPADPPGHLRLKRGLDETAIALLWFSGDGYRLKLGERVSTIGPGDSFEVAGRRFEVLRYEGGGAGTSPAPDLERPPLVIVARWDTVHVHRGGEIALILSGMSARLVSELVRASVPLDWAMLAQELWSDERDWGVLRGRLDVTLGRLRKKLKTANLPPTLVSSNRCGQIELVLAPGDAVLDET